MKFRLQQYLFIAALAVLVAALWPVPHAAASFMKPEQAHDAALHEQILKLVETYAPNELPRWKEELEKRRELRAKLNEMKRSRDFQKKHEEMKKEWQRKIDTGEITREEAKKIMEQKHKQYKEKRKQWKEEGKKLNEQLAEAVKKSDQKAIQTTLDEMLTRLVKANEMMSEKLKQFE